MKIRDVHPAAICIVLYLLGAVLAFGHCASRTSVDPSNRHISVSFQAASPSILAAVFWPFYVSWTLFEPKKVEP